MTRLVLLLVAGGLVLALAGPAPAGIELPDGFDPDDYQGVWLLGSEPGNSWTQSMWVNVYGVKATHYQFQIWTGDTTNSGGMAQSFTDPGLVVSHYGLPGPAPPWTVNYSVFDGVANAQMWAGGSAHPSTYCQGDRLYLTFAQGDISNYPNPYNCTWSNTPEFVLQMQMYGYKVNDPTKEVKRWANQEFYFNGTNWGTGTSQSQPSPSYLSGASGHGPGEWTQNEPLPEPGSVAIWGSLAAVGLAGAWWRRRRKAA